MRMRRIDDLQARLAKTLAFVKSLERAAIDAAADKDITFPSGPSVSETERVGVDLTSGAERTTRTKFGSGGTYL